jgi:5-methylcytosine-specific restriction enzyme subunit McrC
VKAEAPVRRLLLQEHRPSAPVVLDPVQRDALLLHPANIDVRPEAGEAGSYVLTPCERIGSFALPGLVVIVRPKIGVPGVLHMLRLALGLPTLAEDEAGLGESTGLLEAVAVLFDAALRRAFHRGILQGYREEEDALLTLRGRLRVGDQIRSRQGRFPPLEVRFDEFGEDVLENRILLAALLRLRRMRLASLPLRRSLAHHLDRLERVRRVEFGARSIPEPPLHRLNRHYSPALSLARAILEASSPELAGGSLETPSFLVDMNRLFEAFLVRGLREELGLDSRSFPQGGKGRWIYLDTGRRLPLHPDLSWWQGGRCVWVGDAKYKRLEPGEGPRPGDTYQMLAYLVALDMQRGMLVYAAADPGTSRFVVRHLDRVIEVVRFGLGGDACSLQVNLRGLAGLIGAHAEPAHHLDRVVS